MTSPAYILENPNGTTLCIPTAFVSWTGEALDKKTPVAAFDEGVNKQAQRVLKLFGHKQSGAFVASTAGPEQEYFLIDRNFFFAPRLAQRRPHAVRRRSRRRGKSSKINISARSPNAFWHACSKPNASCSSWAFPVKTRHNEVAPAQYEIAPVYENGQHRRPTINSMIMLTLKQGSAKSTAWNACCTKSRSPVSTVRAST